MKPRQRKPKKPPEPKKSWGEKIGSWWQDFKESLPFFALYGLIGVVLTALGVPDKIGNRGAAAIGAVLTLVVTIAIVAIMQKIRNANHR